MGDGQWETDTFFYAVAWVGRGEREGKGGVIRMVSCFPVLKHGIVVCSLPAGFDGLSCVKKSTDRENQGE